MMDTNANAAASGSAPMDVPCITVGPSAPHTHTIVFLHGRGDDARSFMSSLELSTDKRGRTLADALPSFRWVFPQAPMRRVASSPSPEVWPQWFDVWNASDFADHEEHQAEGLRESVPAISRILAGEAALLDGRWDRIVLAGISMGGATSAHTLLNLEVPLEAGGGRLGAFIGFSSRCPFSGRTLAEMRRALDLPLTAGDGGGDSSGPDYSDVLCRTPILLEHCADDSVVPVANGRALRETLRGFGAKVVWKEYPSGGHWFNSPAGIDDAIEFLNHHLLGNGSGGDA